MSHVTSREATVITVQYGERINYENVYTSIFYSCPSVGRSPSSHREIQPCQLWLRPGVCHLPSIRAPCLQNACRARLVLKPLTRVFRLPFLFLNCSRFTNIWHIGSTPLVSVTAQCFGAGFAIWHNNRLIQSFILTQKQFMLHNSTGTGFR